MVAGVLTWGVVSDLYGRKRVLVTMLVLLSLTGLLTALAPTYPAFVVARALNAFIVKPAYFTYMLEVANTSNHSTTPRVYGAVCGRNFDIFYTLIGSHIRSTVRCGCPRWGVVNCS